MDDAMARLRAYSKALLATGPKSFEVPELEDPADGSALKIYVWPASARERGVIFGAMHNEDWARVQVQTLVLRARDANKQPLFSEKDVEELLDLGLGGLLDSICQKINAAWPRVTVEEAKGN